MLTRRDALAGLAAGFAASAVTRPALAADRVRIGYQKMGSLALLKQQGRLEAQRMAVEWVEFNSGPPMLEALNAGAVDFAATGDTPPIFAQAAGADLVYVGAQPLTGAAEALLVAQTSAVHSLADLRGKRIAFTKGSSAHNFLVVALESAGLKPADIQPVYLQPPDGGAAFRSGAVDAWSIWDPFYAIAQLDPATRVLMDGQTLARTNNFFLAGRGFATRSASTVGLLLDAINAVAVWARANPDDLVTSMAAVTGVSVPAQRLAAPRGVYAVQPMDDTIIRQQQAIVDRFASLRIIPSAVDVRSAVWRPPQ